MIELEKLQEEDLYQCSILREIDSDDLEELMALIKLQAKREKEIKVVFKLCGY